MKKNLYFSLNNILEKIRFTIGENYWKPIKLMNLQYSFMNTQVHATRSAMITSAYVQ